MKEIPIDLSLSEAYKLRDEITYLRDESKTKNCIRQTLLENKKVIQDAANSETFKKIGKIPAEQKSKILKPRSSKHK